jgi:hypothetical protein
MKPSVYKAENGYWYRGEQVLLNSEGVRAEEQEAALAVVEMHDPEYTVICEVCIYLHQVIAFSRYLEAAECTMVQLQCGNVHYLKVSYERFEELFREAFKWQLVEHKNG